MRETAGRILGMGDVVSLVEKACVDTAKNPQYNEKKYCIDCTSIKNEKRLPVCFIHIELNFLASAAESF